ncbi:MAG: GNAT family N-acetyltransferase [Alphaproteobacteria bacterium]|nr:GNAT family N-acetyltransferase [Alphaproteobacteria bacterium]
MTFIIHKATEKDVPALASIHVAGWQGAYGGVIDQGYIDAQTVDSRTEEWREWLLDETTSHLLAFKEGKPVGFISYGALRTPPPGTSKIRPLYSSEIYGVYLLPENFRQGIGTSLLKEAVSDLIIQKHQSLCLWVLEKNMRGRGFYEKMGGQRVGKKMVEFGPTKAKELCYGWRNISEILEK